MGGIAKIADHPPTNQIPREVAPRPSRGASAGRGQRQALRTRVKVATAPKARAAARDAPRARDRRGVSVTPAL